MRRVVTDYDNSKKLYAAPIPWSVEETDARLQRQASATNI
jgi:hypothetical protein